VQPPAWAWGSVLVALLSLLLSLPPLVLLSPPSVLPFLLLLLRLDDQSVVWIPLEPCWPSLPHPTLLDRPLFLLLDRDQPNHHSRRPRRHRLQVHELPSTLCVPRGPQIYICVPVPWILHIALAVSSFHSCSVFQPRESFVLWLESGQGIPVA